MPDSNSKTENFKRKFFLASLHLILAVVLVITTPLLLSGYYESTIERFREVDTSSQTRAEIQNYRARVTEVLEEVEDIDVFSGTDMIYQVVIIKFLEGELEGETRELNFPLSTNNKANERLQTDDVVVVARRKTKIENLELLESEELIESDLEVNLESQDENLESNLLQETQNKNPEDLNQNFKISEANQAQENQENLTLVDRYRLDGIFWLVGLFLVVILILAGVNGLTAALSVVFSLTVLIQFLIPQIINGANIIWITFLVSIVIGLVSLFLSHGFSKRILISSLAMLITLILSTFFADFAVNFTSLTGLSSDEVFALQTSGVSGNINFQGLLLAGIIIGSIGVLDDVIVAQATAIEEISLANPALRFADLIKKGFRIGREHIISMVNSLAFAYVGSSLPILLLFVLYNTSDTWLTVNQEIISEEIVRTIVGSMTLFLAVPITTLLAAKFLKSS